jgi:hypothetical protein
LPPDIAGLLGLLPASLLSKHKFCLHCRLQFGIIFVIRKEFL